MDSSCNRLTVWVDNSFWWLLLAGMVFVSTHSGRFDSMIWQTASLIFFFYTALYFFVLTLLPIGCNSQGIVAAKWALTSMCLIVVFLALQLVWPADTERLFPWQGELTKPSWFDSSKGVVSAAPIRTGWRILSTLIGILWLLVLICQIHSRARLKQLLWVLLIIAALHALVGIAALQAGVFLVDPKLLDGHFHAARGWFVNRNHFAALLIAAGSAGAGLGLFHLVRGQFSWRNLSGRELAQSAVIAAILLLVGIALVMSRSRAAIIAPLLSLLLVSFIWAFQGYRLKRVVTTAIGVLTTSAVLITLFGQPLVQRFSSGGLSFGERVEQWKITWLAISEAPIMGYGAGSYGVVFQAVRDHVELRQVIYNQAHNEYLHILVEQGVVGLSLFLIFLFSTAYCAVQTLTDNRSNLVRVSTLAAVFAAISALVQALVDFNLQVMNVRWFFFVAVAIIFAAPSIRHRHSSQRVAGL